MVLRIEISCILFSLRSFAFSGRATAGALTNGEQERAFSEELGVGGVGLLLPKSPPPERGDQSREGTGI